MTEPERDPAVQRLIDESEIRAVVLRYCRGVDRCDRALVESCYHPDATDEHGSFMGTRDEYLEWLFGRMLPRYCMTYHFVGNLLVEVLDATRARSEAYGISWHELAEGRSGPDITSAFRYVDDFEKRDGTWRIARRVCTLEWVRRDDPALRFEASPTHRRGVRDRTDAVYWPWARPGDEAADAGA